MNLPEEITQTYIIDKAIGEGGAGVVYLATHTRLKKKVVLKKIKGAISTDFVNSRAEVDILKNLRHSYLPQVIDFIESSEGIFTVMDYIDGESLQAKLDRGYRFTEKEVRKYFEQICEAVRYLHSQNPPIIHGDIKPDNIMITKEGNVCLIDFNISGFLSGSGLKATGYTPGYSSPEQMAAFKAVAKAVNEYKRAETFSSKTDFTPNKQADSTYLWKENIVQAPESTEPVFAQSQPIEEEPEYMPEPEDQEPEPVFFDDDIPTPAVQPQRQAPSIPGQIQQIPGQRPVQPVPQMQQMPGQRQAQPVPQMQQMSGQRPIQSVPQMQQTPVGRQVQPAPQMQQAPIGRQVQPSVQGGPTTGNKPTAPLQLPDIETEVDFRSDIYSIGATIYTLLGGNVKNLKSGRISFPNKVSDGMRIIVSKALEQKPKKRYQSAAAMLKAVQHVQKMDGTYRSLLRKQHFKIFMYCFLLAAAVVLMVLGKRKLTTEREDNYTKYVKELETAAVSKTDYKSIEEVYNKALEIHDDRLDPYYYRAKILYNDDNILGTTDFISEVEGIKPAGSSEMYSKLWYLMADCLFKDEDYPTAAAYYEKSIEEDPENVSLYRDYAISLVYGGKINKAETVLDTAIEKGMKEADIYMVEGEIARIHENNVEAIGYFDKVLRLTDNEQQRLRAAVGYSKSCCNEGTEDLLIKNTERLKEVLEELSQDNKLLIYEELGSTYIMLGDMMSGKSETRKKEYFLSAAEVYKEIVNMNWGNSITYSNLVVLNQRADNLTEAEKWAKEMCEKYPDNYVSYMRRALVEAELQNSKADDERDYTAFVEYYEKAEELYSKRKSSDVDQQMFILEDTYSQIKETWLD